MTSTPAVIAFISFTTVFFLLTSSLSLLYPKNFQKGDKTYRMPGKL